MIRMRRGQCRGAEQIQALLPWNVKVVLDEQKEIAGPFAAVRRLTATPYPGFRRKTSTGIIEPYWAIRWRQRRRWRRSPHQSLLAECFPLYHRHNMEASGRRPKLRGRPFHARANLASLACGISTGLI
jgi:hypothetical protein